MQKNNDLLTCGIAIIIGVIWIFFTKSSTLLNLIIQTLISFFSLGAFSNFLTNVLGFDSFKKNSRPLLITIVIKPIAVFIFFSTKLFSLVPLPQILSGICFVYYGYGLKNINHTLFGLIKPIQYTFITLGIAKILFGTNMLFHLKPLTLVSMYLKLRREVMLYSFAIVQEFLFLSILAMIIYVFIRYSKYDQA
ncbi:hypothetical protein [Inediibacterium massiliense]|uniref:hypothetical protein n=1 Tax=Inediibacterium massiliense TaxID=1658111 RepID=UPI0006B53C6A|nr:hypothetical protein [Inediibacterium massiliense]